MKSKIFASALLCLLFVSGTPDRNDGVSSFTVKGLEKHIQVLASDEFQGRRPFTIGEKKTLHYLESQFHEMGIGHGNKGSYLQTVPMVEITPTADSIMTIQGKDQSLTLAGYKDYVLSTQRTEPVMSWKEEEIVFAGFGVVAPEYNWNDYAHLDVKNKIVLVLVNDPGFEGNDSTFFKGKTMTYYGRWTYKFEEAARQGAKGCFVIHNTPGAGYGFNVLQNGWNAPRLYLDPRGKKEHYCEGVGWITTAAAEKLFTAAGLNFKENQAAANQRGFKAVPLPLKASTSMQVRAHFNKTHNVIAKITGTKWPDEYIIYSAHWDHLGIGMKDASGDSIYNGALDNASGTAGLLELAKAFKSMKVQPYRSIVFLAVTAEEQGLWGSAYYAENPIYPKEHTVANINMDGINPFGKMHDIAIVGSGQSELEDYLREEAAKEGRYVTKENEPEKGHFFRSDHFNFARIGVPALYAGTGVDHIEKGPEYGKQRRKEYGEKFYHRQSDEYDPKRWNMEGGVEDLKLLFQVGKRLAFEQVWPEWYHNSEFRPIRESYRLNEKAKSHRQGEESVLKEKKQFTHPTKADEIKAH